MSLTAAVSGFVVVLLSVQGTVRLHLYCKTGSTLWKFRGSWVFKLIHRIAPQLSRVFVVQLITV